MVTLIWTYPNISGTFKSYPSHRNKQFFRFNRPNLTKCNVFMHSNNHKFHNGNFTCLGIDLHLQIKKSRFKRWYCTAFQESTCYCVTWKTKYFFVQKWFLTITRSHFYLENMLLCDMFLSSIFFKRLLKVLEVTQYVFVVVGTNTESMNLL